jgi:hypothetical protein
MVVSHPERYFKGVVSSLLSSCGATVITEAFDQLYRAINFCKEERDYSQCRAHKKSFCLQKYSKPVKYIHKVGIHQDYGEFEDVAEGTTLPAPLCGTIP